MTTSRTPRVVVAVALALFALEGAAAAEPFRDSKTGLEVATPDGYEVKRMPPQGQNATRVSLKRSGDRDTGCQVGFAPTPWNASAKQAEINEMMGTSQYQALARSVIGSIYDTLSTETIRVGDVTGVALVADIKPQPGYPERSKDIRNYMVLLETPKGRTTVACVGEKATFAARKAEFERVARGVTPPR